MLSSGEVGSQVQINASFDAGWQKRGSGRSYNSLSGNFRSWEITPGIITLSFNKNKVEKYQHRIRRENTRKYRRKREKERKKKRTKASECKEVLEGTTYKSNVQFQAKASKDDTTPIPEASFPPIPCTSNLGKWQYIIKYLAQNEWQYNGHLNFQTFYTSRISIA